MSAKVDSLGTRKWKYGDDFETTIQRSAFTPGWHSSLNAKEGLPIKINGKIIKTYLKVENGDDDNDLNDESSEISQDISKETESIDLEDDHSYRNFTHSNDQNQDNEKKFKNLIEAKMYIAGICSTITSNPEKSLFKRKKNELEIDDYPRLNDLLELLKHSNFEIIECAMLSSLLIFKDICPSYRIRLEKDDVQFKKETKKKIDLEKSLLTSYKNYIEFLDKNVAIGLGDPWKKIISWNHSALFGLSAFRCQCELAKSLFHFNFRSNLLASILSRGVQQIEDINKLCFSTIDYIFKTDTNGEVSFEIVRLIGQTLATHKYEVDENFLKMLFNVKLRVHADDSNQIRKQAKLSKKKRKKIADNVENSLLESEAVNTNSLKRFQLDSLNEICLIYFRVIKNKVGYDLFPVALEGMGKIGHLVNIDTMEDLVNLLLSYMPLTKSVPSSIRLHSIRCALTILSGPGKELNMDMNPFIDSLYEEIKEISAEEHECWALVIDCIVLGLIKRQETRPNVISYFVRQLFLATLHSEPSISLAILTSANSLLIRYPNVRQKLSILIPQGFSYLMNNNDEKSDLVMEALQTDKHANLYEGSEKLLGDGSWVFPLVNLHPDKRFKRLISAFKSNDIINLPNNNNHMVIKQDYALEKFVNNLPQIFDSINPNRKINKINLNPRMKKNRIKY